MALLAYTVPVVDRDSLESLQEIGKGGFGKIYKAKHKIWMTDVAVKLLQSENSASLLKEADLMHRSTNPYVLSIRGVYRCDTQVDGGHAQFGLVMDYMERGSLKDLLEALRGPAPWSLTSRIVYQIALGMNFLHQLTPPLLHLDLKPSNVLLDGSLNAKITDFGLAKIVQSVSKSTCQKDSEIGGTTSYMPPEAFDTYYCSPAVTSDVYSYGVLLWSVIAGREPYENAFYTSHLKYRVKQGDRPDMALIEGSSEGKGHDDLIKLMKQCWNGNPELRPSFRDCIEITNKVYELCHNTVDADVYLVLTQLKKKDELSSTLESLSLTTKENSGSLKENSFHAVKAEAPPTQESGATSKYKQTGSHKSRPSLSPSVSGQKHNWSPNVPLRRSIYPQRQISIPGHVTMTIENSKGVQIGNNNTMIVNKKPERLRQRHSTAPSTVNSSNSQSQPPNHQQNSSMGPNHNRFSNQF